MSSETVSPLAVMLRGVIAALLAVLAGALLVADPARSTPTISTITSLVAADAAPGTLFSSDSFWNRPLPDDAPLDPDSKTLVAAMNHSFEKQQREGTGPWIATHSYSTPVFEVPADQETVRVALDNASADWRRSLQAAFEEVPIPAHAKPASGTDGHMTIWQPSTDRLWEFWRARKEADGWHASWGGAIADVSQSRGYFTKEAWPGAHNRWGATATSLPLAGGLMMLNEFAEGEFDHALAMAIPSPRATHYSWPAQRTDGTGQGPDYVPEGARFRLDPKLNLDALQMHPVTRMMAEAAQKYGIVVRDKTPTAFTFYAEDPYPNHSPSPYWSDNGYFRNRYPTQFLAQFPWKHLQLLRMKLCSNQYLECSP